MKAMEASAQSSLRCRAGSLTPPFAIQLRFALSEVERLVPKTLA